MPFKIVYLDDEADLCQVFEDNFGTLADVSVQTFTKPSEAIREINSNPPDLIKAFKLTLLCKFFAVTQAS